ncbi:MAG: CNNM domain-containing protein, partial [Planctomycetota bacterium]
NNIVNTAAAVLATALAISFFGNEGIFIATLVMTFLLIQLCEITPKVFASQLWEKVAFGVAPPLRIFGWIFYPAVVFSSFFTRFLFGLFGRKIESRNPLITREELRHMVNITSETGHLKKHETEMLENVFKFHDRLIKEVMLPKEKIDAIDFNGAREEQLKFITDKHHTRIPVYQNNLAAADNIKGILHTKEYLNTLCYQNLIVLEDLLHLPFFVDEDKKISEVLQELRSQKLHMALVTDKNKQVKGLVTIEDIIEEIIGEAG